MIAAMILSAVLGAEWLSYGEAYKEYVRGGAKQPIVVYVGAEWCPACKTMKPRLKEVVAEMGLGKTAILAEIDYDEDRKSAKSVMDGTSLPQTVLFYFTDERPEPFSKVLRGSASKRQIKEFLNAAATK